MAREQPDLRRLTATIAFLRRRPHPEQRERMDSGEQHREAISNSRLYAFRADGRPRSARRGSPTIASDLLIVVRQGTGGRPEPEDLMVPHLHYWLGRCLTPHATGAAGAVPSVRASFKTLETLTVQRPLWRCCEHHRAQSKLAASLPRAGDSPPGDTAPPLATTPGSVYLVSALSPLIPFNHAPAPGLTEHWESWAESVQTGWRDRMRDDQESVPVTRVLSRPLSEALRQLARDTYGADLGVTPPGTHPTATGV